MIGQGKRFSSLPVEIRDAITAVRGALVAVAMASGLVNLLMLVGPVFMLQTYDRVLPSRSIPTLVGLLVIALVLLVVQAGVDVLRSRLLAANRAKTTGDKIKALVSGFKFSELKPEFPGVAEPRTGKSMGAHCEDMAKEWSISRDSQDELAAAEDRWLELEVLREEIEQA
mgnify:CR=1 FL=1